MNDKFEAGEKPAYEFEGFRLDPERRLLVQTAERRPVALSPRVFDTLLCFVEHRGKLIDKNTLLQAIWPDAIVEENSLNQNISILRRALGEKPSEHRFIVTVPGRGYRFVPQVTVVNRDAASAARGEPLLSDPAHTTQIADAIVRALRAAQPGSLREPIAPPSPAPDREANELYLQARALLAMPAEAGLRQAMALLERALIRDARFARALSTLAGVRLHCVLFGYPLTNALEDAERDATRALELDPTLSEAHAALGQLSAFRGEWLNAESRFRTSLSAAQYDALTAVNYCTCLAFTVGHLSRAEREMYEARRFAPASSAIAMCQAILSSMHGRDEEAVRLAKLATALGDPLNLVPIPQIHSHAARRAGRQVEAAEHLVKGLHPQFRAAGGAEVAFLVHAALADAHKIAAATAAVRELLPRARPADIGPVATKDLLLWCGLLNAIDLAYEFANFLLDEYAREGTVGCAWDPLWMPEMRVFRQDPRFQAFVTRLGLIEYWQVHGPPDGCELRAGKLICH